MKTLKLSYAVCGGLTYGERPCGKELRTPKDGLIFDGAVHLAGPLDGDTPAAAPLVGAAPGVRDGGERYHARCWDCFLRDAKAPILDTVASYAEESYRPR